MMGLFQFKTKAMVSAFSLSTSSPSIQANKLFLCNEAVYGFVTTSNCAQIYQLTETLSYIEAKRALDGLHVPQLRPISDADYQKALIFLLHGEVCDHVEFGMVHCWTRVR